MRRSDKEIVHRDEMFHIMDRALYCHVALSADGEPYIIPMSFGRVADSVFIHTAHVGEKVHIISKNPIVRLAFECDVKLVTSLSEACNWSFSFFSVVARGIIHELTDLNQKKNGLAAIMAHYSDKEWGFPEVSIERVRVWEIPLGEMTGKKAHDKT